LRYLRGAERDLERERSGRRGGGDLSVRRLGGDLRGGGDLARLPGGGDLPIIYGEVQHGVKTKKTMVLK